MEAHFSKRPHPDVPESYWGDEVVPKLGEDGEPDEEGGVRIVRHGRRPHGQEDLSDWGKALRAGLEAAPAGGDPSSSGDETSDADGTSDDDSGSESEIEDHDDGGVRVTVVRKLIDAQLGTPADGSAELVRRGAGGDGGAFEDEDDAEAQLNAAAAEAAAGGGGELIAAAVSQAAMDEAVRPAVRVCVRSRRRFHACSGGVTCAAPCRRSPSCGSRATRRTRWARSWRRWA